jgi:hypothetical protein
MRRTEKLSSAPSARLTSKPLAAALSRTRAWIDCSSVLDPPWGGGEGGGGEGGEGGEGGWGEGGGARVVRAGEGGWGEGGGARVVRAGEGGWGEGGWGEGGWGEGGWGEGAQQRGRTSSLASIIFCHLTSAPSKGCRVLVSSGSAASTNLHSASKPSLLSTWLG